MNAILEHLRCQPWQTTRCIDKEMLSCWFDLNEQSATNLLIFWEQTVCQEKLIWLKFGKEKWILSHLGSWRLHWTRWISHFLVPISSETTSRSSLSQIIDVMAPSTCAQATWNIFFTTLGLGALGGTLRSLMLPSPPPTKSAPERDMHPDVIPKGTRFFDGPVFLSIFLSISIWSQQWEVDV